MEEHKHNEKKEDHEGHAKDHAHADSHSHTHDAKTEHKHEDNPTEKAKETKAEVKKVHIKKKDEAIAYGDNMHISKRHGQYICAYIKNKKIDDSIIALEKVVKMRLAIPYKGEVPHRKGMMSGRYPVKAAGFFIKLLKGLRGNVIVNGMDLDNTVIFDANSNWAARPRKSDNRKAKRSNVIIIARERSKK